MIGDGAVTSFICFRTCCASHEGHGERYDRAGCSEAGHVEGLLKMFIMDGLLEDSAYANA